MNRPIGEDIQQMVTGLKAVGVPAIRMQLAHTFVAVAPLLQQGLEDTKRSIASIAAGLRQYPLSPELLRLAKMMNGPALAGRYLAETAGAAEPETKDSSAATATLRSRIETTAREWAFGEAWDGSSVPELADIVNELLSEPAKASLIFDALERLAPIVARSMNVDLSDDRKLFGAVGYSITTLAQARHNVSREHRDECLSVGDRQESAVAH